ncbi:MAG: AlpA family phage regulatory protein [Pseudomonadota bacterium]
MPPSATRAGDPMQNTDHIVKLKQLTQILKMSRSSIYTKINPQSKYHDPTFPRPLKLGMSAVGWSHQEVMSWLSAQKGSAYPARSPALN